jgi:seryl-tRNA synthetase
MLDIKYIREHKEEVKANCVNRLASVDIDKLLDLDEQRKKLSATVQELRGERNKKSKTKPTAEEIAKMKAVGDEIQIKEGEMKALEDAIKPLLLAVPNLTHENVKVSDDEDDNPVLKHVGEPTKFKFEAKDHLELAQALNLIDLERAAKVSGAKFYYLKGKLAELEQAVIAYTLDVIKKHGFELMATPYLASSDIIEQLGFNPRGESTQVYNIEKDNLSLIGTAEITLGAYHADETLDAKDLPKKYVAMTPCFRTEAGSYSKFSKGLFRVHQFNKVEMFIYAHPDQSEILHFEILKIEEEIWKGLGIPFRVVDHCTADLGNPSSRTFDLEAWLPAKPNKDGQKGDWAEITSCSNCTDYQARGLNIRFKNETGEKDFLHTLNGTGVAASRALVAILENYQQADGSIEVPKVLRNYLDFKIIK